MQVKICDRCQNIEKGIKHKIIVNGNEKDLCEDCFEEFKEFINKKDKTIWGSW